MRLTWTNSEWDNFSGVASKDNLMMLESGDDFLNAGGNDGNWRNDRKYYAGDETSVDFKLDDVALIALYSVVVNNLDVNELIQSANRPCFLAPI